MLVIHVCTVKLIMAINIIIFFFYRSITFTSDEGYSYGLFILICVR